jgi:hypothetical protein
MQVRIVSEQRPESAAEAADWLEQWLAPFVGHEKLSTVAAPTLERALARAALAKKPRDMPTHRLVLARTGGAFFANAVATLRVGAGSQPGAELELELNQELELAEVEVALTKSLRAAITTRAWAGQQAWAVDGFNVFSFQRNVRAGRLPKGASSTVVGSGVLIRACELGASETQQRESVRALVSALASPEPIAASFGDGRPADVAPVASSAQLVVPPQVSQPARVVQSVVNLDETAPIPASYAGPVPLPFTGSLSQEQVDALFQVSKRAAGSAKAQPNPDETVMLPPVEVAHREGGTLREKFTPVAVPILSMDEYAALRAALLVHGEEHLPTLTRYGLVSVEARELLRQRFNAAFQRDESLRERFVVTMQEQVRLLRAKGGGL